MMRFGFNELYERGRFFSGFNGMHSWAGMLVGGLFCLGVTILVVVLIIGMIRRHRHGYGCCTSTEHMHGNTNGRQNNISSTESALTILNERYAKGEINQEEYLAKKADLMK